MARRHALAVCATRGCLILTPGGRCPACTQRARSTRLTGGAVYDARWERTRKAYLKTYPLCQCDECAALPRVMRPWATEVHHIDGLGHEDHVVMTGATCSQ